MFRARTLSAFVVMLMLFAGATAPPAPAAPNRPHPGGCTSCRANDAAAVSRPRPGCPSGCRGTAAAARRRLPRYSSLVPAG
jgi:hypothetical protein